METLAAASHSHYAVVGIAGALLLAGGVLVGLNVLSAGSWLVRALGRNKPIRRGPRREGRAVSDAEVRFFSAGWGLVAGVVGLGWLLIGVRVIT